MAEDVVGNPVAAEQRGLQPGQNQVVIHEPDTSTQDGAPDQPGCCCFVFCEAEKSCMEQTAKHHSGSDVKAAPSARIMPSLNHKPA
jgi:hypothetical protein